MRSGGPNRIFAFRLPTGAVCLGALLLLSGLPLFPLSIAATGGYSSTIDSTDLTGATGSDFESTCTSASDAVIIDITDAVDENEQWYLDVHVTEVNWDPSLHLQVVRVSDGTGLGTISGGTTLQDLDATATPFFEGTGNRASVYVQVVLTGVSVTVGADAYAAQIVFTLRDAM